MPETTTTSVSYTDYLANWRAINSKWQKKWESRNYTKSNFALKSGKNSQNSCRQYQVKLSRLCIEHTHRNFVSRTNQQPTCKNSTCGNQALAIKHFLFLKECPQ